VSPSFAIEMGRRGYHGIVLSGGPSSVYGDEAPGGGAGLLLRARSPGAPRGWVAGRMGMWVGRGRKARAAYGFEGLALIPGAPTINPSEVGVYHETLP
jgi:hypothetical protein